MTSCTSTSTLMQNYDVVFHVLDCLAEQYSTLLRCTLVNRTFNAVASRILYRQVVLCPPFRRVIDLRRGKDEFAEGLFHSACLSGNAGNVLRLEIGGYLSPRPPPSYRLSSYLQDAITRWNNLHTVVLTPSQYHAELFTPVIPLLQQCHHLRSLVINASCTQENQVDNLVQIRDLEALTIFSPTRAILQLLPQWLDNMSASLKCFHLRDNCGSVTPGVLHSFIPHLEQIRGFSLGLSYSLTDDDFFQFANSLPNLTSLDFRYYVQLRPLKIYPSLPNLRALMIRHTAMRTKSDVTRMCTWIRLLLRRSPITSLTLLNEWPTRGVSLAFDGLISHIVSRHHHTITELSMPTAFVGREALRTLFSRCVLLERLKIAVPADVLDGLSDLIVPLVRLHTLHLETRNVKPSHVDVKTEHVRSIMRDGSSNLRHFSVNRTLWEGEWISEKDGSGSPCLSYKITEGEFETKPSV